MDLEKIYALVEILKRNNLSVLEFSEGDDRIRLENSSSAPAIIFPEAAPYQAAGEAPISAPVIPGNYREYKSPMVGIFYASSSPESEPFVKIGDKVTKGDTLCIIEAMKLMNDVASEWDGEVIDICVSNGQLVEYGQTLFKYLEVIG